MVSESLIPFHLQDEGTYVLEARAREANRAGPEEPMPGSWESTDYSD